MTGRQKRTIRRKALRKMAGLMPGAVKKGAGAAAVLASFGCLIYLKNRIIPKYANPPKASA